MNNTFRCTNISKSYRSAKSTLVVLDQISIALNGGEIGMLMGPSGCGKTTLLMIAGGILDPDKGSCEVNGRAISNMNSIEKINFRAGHISFIFQHLNLFPCLTASENIALPLMIDGTDKEMAVSKAHELMVRLELDAHLDSGLDVLSGGQKQRVAIARALIRAPALIICDEPTSNLDHQTSDLVFAVMREYAHSRNCAFLISTHDHRILPYANEVYEFNKGKINAKNSQPFEAIA